MSIALRITAIIDEISRRVGLVAVWLVLLSALTSAFNALFRYSVGAMISIERYAFYERAKQAYAVVVTGERRFYGCFILKKGVIPPP